MDPTGGTGLDLRAFVTVDLYQGNAFRLSGLPVDATGRQVRRRMAELEAARRIDADTPPVGNLLMPPRRTGPDAVIAALRRLQDPVHRLVDELFWLWPLHGGGFGGETLTQATTTWEELSATRSPDRAPALHNRAVAAHVAAMEGTSVAARSVREKWRTAYGNWLAVLNDDEVWQCLKARAAVIADPRLREDTVEAVRAELPALLVGSHAAIAISTPSYEKLLRVHVESMWSSGLDLSTIDRALVTATTAPSRYTEAKHSDRHDRWRDITHPCVLCGSKTASSRAIVMSREAADGTTATRKIRVRCCEWCQDSPLKGGFADFAVLLVRSPRLTGLVLGLLCGIAKCAGGDLSWLWAAFFTGLGVGIVAWFVSWLRRPARRLAKRSPKIRTALDEGWRIVKF